MRRRHKAWKAWNAGKTSLDEPRLFAKEKNPFTRNSRVKRARVKSLFVKLVEYECSECQLSTWMGRNITLQLDHIDGDPTNNEVKNLRLLCPNCHSQTPTFTGKRNSSWAKERKKVTDDALIAALEGNPTVAAALRSVGMSVVRANYERCYALLEQKHGVELVSTAIGVRAGSVSGV